MLKISKVVETHGFEIIHSIVDSIWVKRNSIKSVNGFVNYKSYENLKKDIKDKTGFSISFKGIYKWIIFISSKGDLNELPVLNRYFGIFEDVTIKTRYRIKKT